jgi:glycosyltransferase involved in cell wall biosynthesis
MSSTKIIINNNDKNHKIHIVMCSWKRLFNLKKIVNSLFVQSFSKKIHFHILNNNIDNKNELEKSISAFRVPFNIELTHYDNTHFCFQRYFYIRDVIIEKYNAQFVIIVDDDQIFPSRWVENIYSIKQCKTLKTWHCINYDSDFNIINLNSKENFNYGIPNGCIIDTSIFKKNTHFWNIPTKLPNNINIHIFNDFWLSYVISHIYKNDGWTIQKYNVEKYGFKPYTINNVKSLNISSHKSLFDKKQVFIYLKNVFGWFNNKHINTKINDYQLYNFEKVNNMKIKVAVVTSTNKLDKIDNIINNFKQQLFLNKKLFIVINNNNINIDFFHYKCKEAKINYQIIIIDETFNLGYCLNKSIELLKQQNYDIFSKFDDDDIYEQNYLLEQVYHLNNNKFDIVGKYNIPLFIPEYNNFYTINGFTKNNQYSKICRGSTITFYINNIKHLFNTELKQGIDSLFLKQHIENKGKIYVSSFNNYIWIRYLDKTKHTWDLNLNSFNLIKYEPDFISGNIYNILFDKIYVINLQKDTLKKNIFLQNNKHTNINFSFFSGVDAKNDIECKKIYENYIKQPIGYNGCSLLEKKYNKKMITKIGQIGYLKSMLNIFIDAKEKKYNWIIIFDDDAILHQDFNKLFYYKLNDLKDKHIIRIGTTHHNIQKFSNCIEPYYESPNCDGSFATCYRFECFQYFIDNIKCYNCPFDSGVLRDYKNFNNNNDFTIYPFLAIADVYESSILNESRNLFNLSNKLKWNLDNFNFVNSLRKISVIIPLYNKETTIILSIQSILQQTYTNIEIIVVDDCSTDNSVKIVENFLKQYNGNIKIYLFKHDKNYGCYATRNTGIKNASGNYIAFQDPDDFSLPNRLEIQMNDIIKQNVSITFISIYRLNNVCVSNLNDLYTIITKDKNLIQNEKKHNNYNYKTKLGMVTSLIDIKLFKKYGLYDEDIRHSLDLWFLQNIYLKTFHLNLNNDIYQKVNVTNCKGAFYTFIERCLDKFNFIYYNNTMLYICSIMNENNITNINYNRDKDYELYLCRNKVI